MKEFLSIKEFSKLSGIETTTLRYWDEIGLFSPAKRDPENNYRYYSPEQIISVNFITVLSSLNIPLKKISEIENRRNPENIVRLIEQQEKQLDLEMSKLRECYSIIHTRRELINYGIRVADGFAVVDGVRMDSRYAEDGAVAVDENSIAVMHTEDISLILGPRNNWKEGKGFFEPFTNFCNRADEIRINLSFPIGAMHESWEGFIKSPGEPHFWFSMDPTGNYNRPAGKYMIGFARSYYGQFGDLPQRMAVYAKENSLAISGPVYITYLHDEVCLKDPSQYLSQVCVAVSG